MERERLTIWQIFHTSNTTQLKQTPENSFARCIMGCDADGSATREFGRDLPWDILKPYEAKPISTIYTALETVK